MYPFLFSFSWVIFASVFVSFAVTRTKHRHKEKTRASLLVYIPLFFRLEMLR